MSLFNETKTSLQDECDKTFALESSLVNPRSTDFCHSKSVVKGQRMITSSSVTRGLKSCRSRTRRSRNSPETRSIDRGWEEQNWSRSGVIKTGKSAKNPTTGRQARSSNDPFTFCKTQPLSPTLFCQAKHWNWLRTHHIYHSIFRVSALSYGGAAKLTHHTVLSQPWTKTWKQVVLSCNFGCESRLLLSNPYFSLNPCFYLVFSDQISHCPGR